jgi:elongation factor Ts
MNISVDQIKELRAKTSAGIALCKEALNKANGDMSKAVDYVNERSDVISRLHNETGAKIGMCKLAFEEAGKDFQKAVDIIRERGWADEAGMADANSNAPKDGIIEAYVHGTDRKTVALVELTCVTDFVATNQTFKDFAHDVSLHIAANKPKYVSRENIPQEELDEIKSMFEKEVALDGKPENIRDKIVEGKMNKFYQDNCLMEQESLKEEGKTIKNLLDELIGKVGEPVTIRRILFWEFGKN